MLSTTSNNPSTTASTQLTPSSQFFSNFRNRQVKQYGITTPISVAPPTAHDRKTTDDLDKVLKDENLYESAEEAQKREEVLGKLHVLVREWVRQVSVKKVKTLQIIHLIF